MQIFVNCNVSKTGDGSKKYPFKSINEAVKIAMPNDEVIVQKGIYRELVNPIRGGLSNNERIIFRSEVIGEAIITGAEIIDTWVQHENNVWKVKIPNAIFGDYNPYTVEVYGDWLMNPYPVHTGEVYLNGKAMHETSSLENVLNPTVYKKSWDPEFTVYKWYTEQEDNNTVIYANFQGVNPNEKNVEINVRKACFYPEETGLNYITVSGFNIKQAATQWAPPTAYQVGMVGPHWSKGWIIEDCEISNSRCSGISLGKYLQPENENKWSKLKTKHGTQTERDAICQAQNEGWSKETIGSHIVRRCNIHDCGQTGIVGHLGCVFSTIEDNHIHHINNKMDLFGFEIGGIKLHGAIDVTIKRNHIHNCSRGIWLDWQAQGTRVTQNLFHDNEPPKDTKLEFSFEIGEDIFVEISHGPTLIDNNVMLSSCSSRLSTQGVAFVHNLMAGSLVAVGTATDMLTTNGRTEPRYTPYHVKHSTSIAGFMSVLHGDMRFYNNVFIQQELREDYQAYIVELEEKGITGMLGAPNFISGTQPYNDYPTTEEYMGYFENEVSGSLKGIDKYFTHLPVTNVGNVYLNNAKPCDKDVNAYVEGDNSTFVKLVESNGTYTLETNFFEKVMDKRVDIVTTEILGEAFEPEQKFENPDGTPILFNSDYFELKRELNPIAGPFQFASNGTYVVFK